MSASAAKKLGLIVFVLVLMGQMGSSPVLAQEEAGVTVHAEEEYIAPAIPIVWWIAPVGAVIRAEWCRRMQE